MYLKKICNRNYITLIILLIVFLKPVHSNDNLYVKQITTYLNNLNEFSSTFLQIQNNDISEGLIYLKKKRLRIEYTSPSKIIFILKENNSAKEPDRVLQNGILISSGLIAGESLMGILLALVASVGITSMNLGIQTGLVTGLTAISSVVTIWWLYQRSRAS